MRHKLLLRVKIVAQNSHENRIFDFEIILIEIFSNVLRFVFVVSDFDMAELEGDGSQVVEVVENLFVA